MGRDAFASCVRHALTWGVLLICAAHPGCVCEYHDQILEAMQTPAELEGSPARLEVVDGTPVLHLYGTGDEMAAQYGQLMGPAVRALLGYVESLVPVWHVDGLREYARQAEPNLPDDLRRQIQIAAAEAGVDYIDFLTLNVAPKMACSVLAVWGEASADGELIMGRNAEYFGLGLEDRGGYVMVRHATDETPQVIVSVVGMLGGFTGINADGVAYGNMLIFNATDADDEWDNRGLPVQLAMPIAAAGSADADEMAARLAAMTHAIPMNVMVADRTHALMLELSPNGNVTRRGPDGYLAASNYYIDHPDRAHDADCWRYDALIDAAEEYQGQMNRELMEEAVYDASYDDLNLQAVIFEPAKMQMHVSINQVPAAAGPYQTFDLSALLAE